MQAFIPNLCFGMERFTVDKFSVDLPNHSLQLTFQIFRFEFDFKSENWKRRKYQLRLRIVCC
jgi:hypothetical protein